MIPVTPAPEPGWFQLDLVGFQVIPNPRLSKGAYELKRQKRLNPGDRW